MHDTPIGFDTRTGKGREGGVAFPEEGRQFTPEGTFWKKSEVRRRIQKEEARRPFSLLNSHSDF
jgi:hypothetical protein